MTSRPRRFTASTAEQVARGAYLLATPMALWLSLGQFLFPAWVNSWLMTRVSGPAYAATIAPQLHATTIFVLHVAPSIAFVCLTPIQFSQAIRRRWPKAHRWSGRVFLVSSVMIGLTAIVIGWRHAFAGILESLTTTFSAAYFLVTLERSIRAARRHDRAGHRAWMIRHVATGHLVVTMRFLQPVLLRLTPYSLADLFVAISVGSFILNQLLAEAWIRSLRIARPRPLPAVQATWTPVRVPIGRR